MDESSIVSEVFKQQGLGGLALLVLIYKVLKDTKNDKKECKELEAKKQSGEYVSFQDIKRIGGDLDILTSRVNDHFEKTAKVDIEQASIATSLEYNEKRIVKLEESTEKIYGMLSEIKNHLIKQHE